MIEHAKLNSGWTQVDVLEEADVDLAGPWYRIETFSGLAVIEGRLGMGLCQCAGARLVDKMNTLVEEAVASDGKLPKSYLRRSRQTRTNSGCCCKRVIALEKGWHPDPAITRFAENWMSKQRVSLDDIQHAIRHLEAQGERGSVRRVQQEIGYDDANISRLMRIHRLTQTTMNRMVRVPRARQLLRRSQSSKGARREKSRAGQPAKRQKPPAKSQPLSAQGPESIESSKVLLAAILDRAIGDAGSRSLGYRRAARRWPQSDPACTQICVWIDLAHRSLIKTLEQRGAA